VDYSRIDKGTSRTKILFFFERILFNPQIGRIVDEGRGYSKEIPHKIIPKNKVAISDSKKQAAFLPNFTPFEHPEDKEFFDFSTLLTDKKEFLAKTNFNWANDPSIEDIL
jgi:hypothetical protein